MLCNTAITVPILQWVEIPEIPAILLSVSYLIPLFHREKIDVLFLDYFIKVIKDN